MPKGKNSKRSRRGTARSSHHNKTNSWAKPIIIGGLLASAGIAVLVGYTGYNKPVRIYEMPLSSVSCQLKEEGDAHRLLVAGSFDAKTDNSGGIERVVRLAVGYQQGTTSNGNLKVAVDGVGTGYYVGGDMIITARHVIEGSDGKLKSVIVTSSSDSVATIGYVAATHKRADLALVRYSGKRNFHGVVIKAPKKDAGLSALVIDTRELGMTFSEGDIKKLTFTKIGEEGRYNDSFLSNDDFGRRGMSGSALLENGIYAGTLVVDESRINETSYGIQFNEEGKAIGMSSKTAERQVMRSTNTSALVEIIQAVCNQ